MKSTFENEKLIAEKLQLFKTLKEKEKNVVTETALLSKMREQFKSNLLNSDITEEQSEEIIQLTDAQIKKILETYGDSKKELESEKKEFGISSSQIKNLIGEMIMADCDEKNVQEKKITLPMLGTVSCTIANESKLYASEKEQEEIFKAILEEERLDLLKIDEEKYVQFSKELQETAGIDLPGIIQEKTISTKITLSRK